MKNEIIEFRDISYSYDSPTKALDNISLKLYENQRIAILGTNGSGKSTFFLCCNGVLRPQSGQIFLNKEPISHSNKDLFALRKAVGIVFQDPNQQFIGTTVYDDIAFGVLNLALEEDDAQKRVLGAMAAMNLTVLRDRPPHYLSGGEKKKLSIADIIAMNPSIILFDEPTAFLDGQNTVLFEKTLDSLYDQNKTLVVATHDTDFAFRWADRILLFHNAKLVADDTPHNILAKPSVLKEAEIHPPLIYSVYNMLQKENLVKTSQTIPTSLEELKVLLK